MLRTRWFDKEVAIYPTENGSAAQAWRKVYDLWSAHGNAYGLDLSENRLDQLKRIGERYSKLKNIPVGAGLPPEPTSEEREDPELMASFRALQQLTYLSQNLQVTNFRAFRDSAQAESDPLLLNAHKLLFQADRLRKLKARDSRAKELYEQVFPEWLKVFEKYPRLRDGDLEKYQEDVYAANLNYLRIVQLDNQLARRKAAVAISDMGRRGSPTDFLNLYDLMNVPTLESVFTRVQPLPVMGPIDGFDPRTGKPYIEQGVKERVRDREGWNRTAQPAPPPKSAPKMDAKAVEVE
jgi:hypothetical protein